tara:strand:- start:12 stop:167 length:156 start_codon:yes stop_codon:yes gene_type:complete
MVEMVVQELQLQLLDVQLVMLEVVEALHGQVLVELVELVVEEEVVDQVDQT